MTLIAQISDLHLRPKGFAALRVSETNMLAERAVDVLTGLRPRPDAVVVTGDVANDWGEADYRTARRILSRLPMPVYLLAGNHDDPALMKEAFPSTDWAKQGPAGRVYYAVDIGDLRLVALDSSAGRAGHGELEPEQLDFLERELSANDHPTIVAIHHPPFAVGLPVMDRIGLRDPEKLAAVLARHRHVVRLICGHVHRPIVASFGGTIAVIAPSIAHQIELTLDDEPRFRFNFEPPAYFLHRWTPAGLVTHTAYVERFPGPYPFDPEPGYAWE